MPSRSEVHTSNRQNTLALEGTIRLVLTDDAGDQHQYDIAGALYDPESPFNLLGIPFLSKHFHDAKNNGTRITSGAYQSTFVWDHGKNERTFQHGVDCLPTLYKAETRDFSVQFKDPPAPVKPKKRQFSNIDVDICKGMELSYKDGEGNCAPV
eukprot:scaffold209902_cov23-Cyclotella_meneghiniana.AAC.2